MALSRQLHWAAAVLLVIKSTSGGDLRHFKLVLTSELLLTVGRARAGWSGNQNPVGAIFPSAIRTDPESHAASCRMGAGSFPGLESGRGVTLTPHPF
jgi:hypothetical protein